MNRTETLFASYYAPGREAFKEKRPRILTSITLLDILANGVAIRVHREAVGGFDCGIRSSLVVSVRKPARYPQKGWSAVQYILSDKEEAKAILLANKLAQREIAKISIEAIA
ncbi:TPA: hypothetical protein ACJI3N_005307 [Raoultella planticola]